MESAQFWMEENRFRCWEPTFGPLRCPQDISQEAGKDCLPRYLGPPSLPRGPCCFWLPERPRDSSGRKAALEWVGMKARERVLSLSGPWLGKAGGQLCSGNSPGSPWYSERPGESWKDFKHRREEGKLKALSTTNTSNLVLKISRAS